MRAAGKRASLAALLLRPPARFLRMYGLQLGFLDGVHGLLLCTLSAHSVWLKYARLFEAPGPASQAAGTSIPDSWPAATLPVPNVAHSTERVSP